MNVLAGGQLVGFFLFLGTSVGAQGVRLNGALDAIAIVGDVEAFTISPDGQWAAYLADQEVDGQVNLYTARTDGTGPVHRINGPLVANGQILRFVFTSDSSRVIYHADEQADEVWEIFSAPSNGSTPAVKLNGPLVSGGDVYRDSSFVPWAFTSDGQWMVYLADEDVNEVLQLFAVSTDGSAPSLPLLGANLSAFDLRIAADDATVVFAGASTTDSTAKLFKVPLDGSAAAVRLNGTITAGTSINRFEVAPDGSRVLYLADRSTSGKVELFSRPLDLSAPAIVLNDALASNRDVFTFEIASTSQRVVYKADRDVAGNQEIFSVPVDGSAAPVKLNPLDPGSFLITPAGDRVVFITDSNTDFYSVPIDASAPATFLLSLPLAIGFDQWGISPDGTRLLIASRDLFSVPVDGSSASLLLNPPRNGPAEKVWRFVIAPDSSRVAYAQGNSATAHSEFYSAPLDGSSSSIPLLALPPWSSVGSDFAIDAPSNKVFVRCDDGAQSVTRLLAVPLNAPGPAVVLNDPLPTVVLENDVRSFGVSPDGRWAVYADSTGFHSAPLRQDGRATRLTPPELSSDGEVPLSFGTEIGFTPDSRLAFLSVSTATCTLLYRVPVDGSQPAERIDERSTTTAPINLFGRFHFTPDGATLVHGYLTSSGFGVLSRPVEGTVPPVLLSDPQRSSLPEFLSVDGSRAVIAAGSSGIGHDSRLYSRLVDGSAPGVSLLPAGYALDRSFGPAAGNTRVVYSASLDFSAGSPGLYSAPIDASQPPTLLGTGLVVPAKVDPSGANVAWLVANGSALELRHGPVDGSSPSILLASLPATFDPLRFAFVFSPDGTRLVYRANALVTTRYDLFSVPVDASLPPVKVNGVFVAGGNVTEPASPGETPHFAVTPDGQRVVYAADARGNDIFELFSAPITGGGPARILNNPLPAGLQIFPDFHILSNSTDILYRGNPAAGFLPLWQARTDRLGPFKMRSGPFPLPSVVEPGFVVTRGERHVVYRADHGTPGRTELWFAPLQRTRATR